MTAVPNDLLKLTERRMAWLEARQRVLAGNVANADTPGYQPRDVRSFASVLSGAAGAPGLAATDPRHLASQARPDGRAAGPLGARIARPTATPCRSTGRR